MLNDAVAAALAANPEVAAAQRAHDVAHYRPVQERSLPDGTGDGDRRLQLERSPLAWRETRRDEDVEHRRQVNLGAAPTRKGATFAPAV